MTKVTPKKLYNSKWTSTAPENREKHFIVIKVVFNDDGIVELCIIEAVMSKRQMEIDWRELMNEDLWLQGWK